jgi:hypothetical protein
VRIEVSSIQCYFLAIEKYMYKRGYDSTSERWSGREGGYDTLDEGPGRMSIYLYIFNTALTNT